MEQYLPGAQELNEFEKLFLIKNKMKTVVDKQKNGCYYQCINMNRIVTSSEGITYKDGLLSVFMVCFGIFLCSI